MKCKKCGQDNWSDAKFCEHCGAPLENEESQEPKNNKKIIIFVAIVAVLIGLIIIFTSRFSPQENLHEDNYEEELYNDEYENEEEQNSHYINNYKKEEETPEYVEYRTNFNMVTRASGDYDAPKRGDVDEDKFIKIYKTIKNTRHNSTWGQLENGEWICLEDDEYTYCSRN